jgi:hypothetical protein
LEYKVPSDKEESLEQLGISLNRVLCKKTNSNIWVSGDFNLGHIDWDTPAVIPNKPEASLHHKILPDGIRSQDLKCCRSTTPPRDL